LERLIVRQSSFKVNFCLKNRRYKGTCTLYFHPLCLFFFLFFFLSQAIVTKRFPCHNFTSGGNGIRFCNWKVEMGDGWRVEGGGWELHHRDDQTSYSSIFASSPRGSFENILHAVPQSLNSHDALCMAVW